MQDEDDDVLSDVNEDDEEEEDTSDGEDPEDAGETVAEMADGVEDEEDEPGDIDEDGETEDGEGGESEELKEDIYGRLRDSKGNIVSTGVYVPPAKRRQLEEGNEARKERLNRLKKQLKGQLNR